MIPSLHAHAARGGNIRIRTIDGWENPGHGHFPAHRAFPVQRARLLFPLRIRGGVILPWILLGWVMALAVPARAHPFLQNRWQVVVVSNRLAMRATATLREVAVIQGLTPGQLSQPAALIPAISNHAAYVAQHLHVQAQGVRLPIEVLDFSLIVDEDAAGTDDEAPERRHAAYDLGVDLPGSPGPLILRFAHDVLKGQQFAPAIPWDVSHVLAITDPLRKPLGEGVVRIGQDVEITLRPSPGHATPASGEPPAKGPGIPESGPSVSGFMGFLRHGLHHVASGYDHLLFLAALTLATARWRRLLAIIGIFTLAHSLTVTLSALGWLSLPSWVVEPIIAGSIVFVAIQNLVAPRQAQGHGRLLVSFGFGLVHGLGFAGGLADALGPVGGARLAVPIFAFCLGVELAHLAFGAPMFGLMQSLPRVVKPGPDGSHAGIDRLRQLASLVVAMGGSWFLWAALRNA